MAEKTDTKQIIIHADHSCPTHPLWRLSLQLDNRVNPFNVLLWRNNQTLKWFCSNYDYYCHLFSPLITCRAPKIQLESYSWLSNLCFLKTRDAAYVTFHVSCSCLHLLGPPWLLRLLMTADFLNKDKSFSLFFQPNSEVSGAAVWLTPR